MNRLVTLSLRHRMLIIGFLLMAALRSGGMIPLNTASQLKTLSSWLTLPSLITLVTWPLVASMENTPC